MVKLGIFLFRRDCRLDDNVSLNLLAKTVDLILPIFILDSNQIVKTNKNSHYFSNNAVQFICETLDDLSLQLENFNSRLYLFHGIPWTIIANILTRLNKKYDDITLAFNTDFSSYSDKRDNAIRIICNKLNINILESNSDFTLRPIEDLIKSDGEGFKQFGAFYKNAIL